MKQKLLLFIALSSIFVLDACSSEPPTDDDLVLFDEKPDQAAGLPDQFDIEDDKTYHLVINDGTCKKHEGAHDDPSVTLIMNSETLQGIVSGETDGMQAFMAGQLRAEGDMMLATKLGELFKMG